MKLKDYFSVFLIVGTSLFVTNKTIAQYVSKDTFLETTGVSNQGVVSGYEAFAGPYFLWNANNNTTQEIGGAAPGNGVGGKAIFSNDGNLISGSTFITSPVTPEWERTVLSDYSYIFKGIEFPIDGFGVGYSVGQSLTFNGNGIVLRTTNDGNSWEPMWEDEQNRALEALSFPEPYIGYVVGWNDYFAKTTNGGWDWEEQSPGNPADVWYYSAVKFKDADNGVVGAVLDAGGGAIYTTNDGGENWVVATGVETTPWKIVHTSGNTYFMVGGDKVQKSTDNGNSWTTVYHIPGALLLGINFYDDALGIVTGETFIHKTTNGGVTWQELAIQSGLTDGVLWRDVAWAENSNNVIITGTPDVIFESTDGGSNNTGWTWANQDIFNGGPALYSIAVTDNAVHISGSQGNFYTKSLLTSNTHAEMAMYNVANQGWTPLGDLGNQIDISTSSGYSISADGSTVVGLSWTATGQGHAVTWTQADGITDLGSLHAGRSTRADGVSSDGSVIVGWQDFNGPWKSAVWRKNPNGGYFPNEYLLIDPNGNPNDEFNQLGQASAVSSDGNWIGGYGDFAHPNPWIWSEDTGLIDLGDLNLAEGTIGYVSAMNQDGSVVVGWYQSGGGPWDPPVNTPFIWTPETGTLDMNLFVTEELEFDMGGFQIFVPNALSENGHYITGFSFSPNPEPWGEFHTFRLQITDFILNTGINLIKSSVTLYPNPVNNILIIESSDNIESVEIFNLLGQKILNEKASQLRKEIDMSQLSKGMYLVKVLSNGISHTSKIIKE
ncbi:MAG: hypothetical protein CVU03_09085 [Bacteroidetes bacterium HGW-Bacteroidetes-2]|jgi:probable HAF family extracellular repeat protein|nr:MAG: hypothetical protein CVU03_09085 [Bacteroidetes bacterium HGW-Bacteroidetes-2]